MKNVILAVLLSLPLVFTGCSKDTKTKVTEVIKDNKPILLQVVTLGAKKGVELGFSKWAVKDAKAAKEAATLLASDLNDNIIPYLNGKAAFSSQAEIDTFLQSSVTGKLPAEAKDAIEATFAVLDLYVAVPDASNLKADYLDYVKAFANGLKDGANSSK